MPIRSIANIPVQDPVEPEAHPHGVSAVITVHRARYILRGGVVEDEEGGLGAELLAMRLALTERTLVLVDGINR